MRPGLPDEDVEPWYRQFWPWLLILLPGSAVIASLTTVYIASRGADDLVVDDYYQDGLAINRQLEKKQRSEDLGIAATLHLSDGHVTAYLVGPVTEPTLNLLFSHPLESDRDFSVTLLSTAPGTYQAVLPRTVTERWHWTMTGELPASWRLDGDVEPRDLGDADPE